jgi:plastocyanin
MAHLLCRFSFLFLSVAVMAKASRVHTVRVGFGGNFVFDPETTKADVGDLVVFEFFPSNHSVVRGEYAKSEACGDGGCQPCVPYELIHPGQQGFHSGNVLTQTVSTNRNVLSIPILLKPKQLISVVGPDL